MRIGIVLSNTPAYSETFFRNKIDALKKSGYRVILFVHQKSPNFNLCEYSIGYNSGNGFLKSISSLFIALIRLSASPVKSYRLFNQNKKDSFTIKQNVQSLIISAHILSYKLDWLHFGFATMALGRENLANIIGAKMAVSIRGYDIIVYPIKHPSCYDLLWKKINKIHYISEDLLELAKNSGLNLAHTKPVKITPAIDTNKFLIGTKKRNNKNIITTTARLHWKKGLEYTLEALALLAKAGIDFEYRIIGDGPERERLVFAAYQLGISDKVEFLGKLPQSEIVTQLSQTDIYIQYSINEGFCNSVLEAQAMGCLCIVSDAEGLSENVLHNQTGFVVQKRNPELLFQAISTVLYLSNLEKQNITSTAINRVNREFNLEQQQQSFIRFYS